MEALDATPLCPAGDLLLKGGDWTAALLSPIANVAGLAASSTLLISPLEEEISGRPEGGRHPTTPTPEASR